jgi:glycosyltransferase involved in cell wall biosynthesis
MMRRRQAILFLNHSATRNGASMLLLHLLQWLRSNADYELIVLSDGSGPLIERFHEVATTWVWRNPLFFLRGLRHPGAVAMRSRLEGMALRIWLTRRRYDLVYANTAATFQHVEALVSGRTPVLWHIHELPYALRLTLGEQRAKALLPTADRVVAVSQSVVDALTGQFGVAQDRVDLVYGFVPTPAPSDEQRHSTRQRILTRVGWPVDAFVVGGCGSLGWRKGTDLFLQIARKLIRGGESDRLRFLWVGGSHKADNEVLQFTHDARALGLDDVCRRVASTSDVDDYYNAMDVFALTSREDPFPLVMLEAAVHGVPTVCFASAGGAMEFLAGGAGIGVPYLDLDAFAVAIDALRTDATRRASLGAAAQQKVRMQHVVETQGPKLIRSIERCLGTHGIHPTAAHVAQDSGSGRSPLVR